MQFLNYFFASILSFSGLLIGIMLVKIAPEEQKSLEKYFYLARRGLLFIMIAFLFFYSPKDNFSVLTLIASSLILFFIEFSNYEIQKKSMLTYSIFGVLFFLSSRNINLFAVESSLILLYGLPTASLIYGTKKRNNYKLIFYNLGFVVILSILFMLTTIFHSLS